MVRPKIISDEKVLDIVMKCLLEKGSQVSTREIAEKTGLSQAALFKRFKTKEDLFLNALATKKNFTRVLDFVNWLESGPKQGALAPQVAELLRRLWNLLKELIPHLIALHDQRGLISPDKFFLSMKNPPPIRILTGIIQFMKNAQQNGQIDPQKDPGILAMNLMGTMQGRVFFSLILSRPSPVDDDDYIKETARNFCEGAAPAHSRSLQ